MSVAHWNGLSVRLLGGVCVLGGGRALGGDGS
jgi:hypothetical protein